MSLQKAGYINRIIDAKIEENLQLFGAVLIEGPKWCGKTWTSLNHANSVVYILDPTGNYSNRVLARMNPALILTGESPHLIDEWQEAPGIWDAIRFDIDQNPGHGKYLLTGSVLPPRESYGHSGTGRIISMQMHPMSLFESMDSSGLISLESLFSKVWFEPFLDITDLIKIVDVTVRGGWPETLRLPTAQAKSIAYGYINAIERSELFSEGQQKRDRVKLSKLLRSLARTNAATVSIKALAMDLDGSERQSKSEEEIIISRDSVTGYLKSLREIFVIEEIPAWSPEIRSKAIIRQTAKRMFTDPSLAIAALGANRERMLHDLKTFGFMFENLCLRDLVIYSGYHGGRVFHYHDNSELEVDAVVEMPDGAWGAFEIKLGEDQVEKAAGTLLRMSNKMVAAGSVPPACLVIVTGGGLARVRDDGIYVVPISTMKP